MNVQWIIFASVLLINTVMAVVIATLLVRRQTAPGLISLVFLLYLLSVWSFSYAMITLLPDLGAKRFWLKVENIGIQTVPVFWFFFTVQYTRLDKWLNRLTGSLFFIIPLITLVILFSERWFQLYYLAIQPFSPQGGPLTITRGPWYVVPLVQSYSLNLIGMGLLIWRAVQYRHIYRRQMFALIGAVLIPISTNVFYQLAPQLIPGFTFRVDLTPISFTISAGLLAMSVFGLRLFDLIPIAHYTVMEHIPQMVLVADSYDRILDANNIAQQWLGKSLDQIIGQSPRDVFRDWPELITRYEFNSDLREEVPLPSDPPRTVELIISLLRDRFSNIQGRVIVAHDITEHKRLAVVLKQTNQFLTAQLAENEGLRALLQEQAIRDPLTNVYNRRFMAEFLNNEMARSERDRTPMSIVLLDIDNFRQFNDIHGYRCGDMILQAFSKFLTERARRGDIICRYGGEEFVVIMPNTSLDTSYESTEAWRVGFSESAIAFEDLKFSATFSAGIAVFPEHGATGDELFEAADRALFRSKNYGRNRVTRASTQL